MTAHSSASGREETPHANPTSRTNAIVNALVRRARAKRNDKSRYARSRAIIYYALETNDPWLAQLVRQADEGESRLDTLDFSQTPAPNEDDLTDDKIKALGEIFCQAGDKSAAALFVLMGTLEKLRGSKSSYR